MPGTKEPPRPAGIEKRLYLFALVMCCAYSVVCLRFWKLQVEQNQEFVAQAAEQTVREERLQADRGVIYARGDVVLADNRASADVKLIPGDCPEEQLDEVCSTLEQLLNVDAARLKERIARVRKSDGPYAHVLVKADVERTDRVRIEEYEYKLPGVLITVHPQRRYHFGQTGGQILGYVSEITREELDRNPEYHLQDLYGKQGIEREYEPLLRGIDGSMLVTRYSGGTVQFKTDRLGLPIISEKDSVGHLLMEEATPIKPRAGDPLFLTLDMDLQAKCESLLQGEEGAIVVLEAETGAVRALASNPTYDPSVFVTPDRDKERKALLQDNIMKPFRSRAFRENYPPGSIFKIMLAAAALEEGVINEHTTFVCPGYYKPANVNRRWNCHTRSGHGGMDVFEAMALSCDVFFYNVGVQLGSDKMAEWAVKMGLGVKTGIDLPGEITGLIPDREWKAAYFAKGAKWERNWTVADTLNTSIGQGSVNATPLQNAVMAAFIFNGGYRIQPYLNEASPPKRSERVLSENTIRIVVEGMRLCIEKKTYPRGTGRDAAMPDFAILGKTGTAQIMSLKQHAKYAREEDIPKHMRDHAWFVAGVMDREPKISICILVEHGHHGSSVAAPLAKDVIQFFYDNEQRKHAPEDSTVLALTEAMPTNGG